MVIASRLHHDSRYAGFDIDLDLVKDRLAELARKDPKLGTSRKIKWQWENEQVVFYKTSLEKIDREYLKKIFIDFDTYRSLFRLPARVVRVRESWFFTFRSLYVRWVNQSGVFLENRLLKRLVKYRPSYLDVGDEELTAQVKEQQQGSQPLTGTGVEELVCVFRLVSATCCTCVHRNCT